MKSTVPWVQDEVRCGGSRRTGPASHINIGHDRFQSGIPERGFAIEDFMKPDSIIVGVDDAQSADTMRQLYSRSIAIAID